MKNATPRMIPPRLRMMAFLRCPMKRRAMYNGEGMGVRRLHVNGDRADALAWSEQILVGDDDLFAFRQAPEDLGVFEVVEANFDGARFYHVVFHDEHTVGQ